MRYLFLLPALILVSCGGGSGESQSYSYYQKRDVEPKQLDLTIEASGEIEAIYSVEIKSKASGEILDLPAEVGDFVKKGTILARIDQRTPKNVLDQAEADLKLAEVRLENAEAQLTRGEALHAEGSIADKNFEEIQEGFASAKSQHVRSIVTVENAKIALDDPLVKSPLDATIISRPVEVGQVISSPPTTDSNSKHIINTRTCFIVINKKYIFDRLDQNYSQTTLKISSYFFKIPRT